jgi:hypothetical protein
LSPGSLDSMLAGLREWTNDKLRRKLPLDVQEVKIFPDDMPLDTLHFTPRLGYSKAKATDMITMGCYNTLWTVRRHLEEAHRPLDPTDTNLLAKVQKWTGFEWPRDSSDLPKLRETWACQRHECVFHQKHCRHGAKQPL